MKPDPMGEPRNPFQVYLLCLGCLSAFTILWPGPASTGAIAQALSETFENIWAGMLLLGCGSTLVGMFWQGDARTGLVIKRAGLNILCYPVLVYAVIVWTVAGWGATTVAMTMVGFAVSAALQARRVSIRIRAAIARNGED